MKLRPHHILCIQKFIGKGYNEDFTLHMNAIVSKLIDNPKVQITITHGCDDICERCPNNINELCTSFDKVARLDTSVLMICNFDYGQTVSWIKLANKARRCIFETNRFNNICHECEWNEICRNKGDLI
ncbi:DUF1284 domain-containing protein [Erysipelotrichaceae bacterium HCN-30851]